jgi:hypothetical protein
MPFLMLETLSLIAGLYGKRDLREILDFVGLNNETLGTHKTF